MTNNHITLSNLKLQNFATFENQEITFCSSFNAIVGETGSGKSLILDALQLIFGSRVSKDLIRKGSSFATIEATFTSTNPSITSYFDEMGFPFEHDEINIKRVIYDNGKTRSFLNHQTCPLSILVKFSRDFIDLVGQFENQKLLSEDYQLGLLDTFAGLTDLSKDYSKSYILFQNLNTELEKLLKRWENKAQREDFLSFQLNEISKLDPSFEDEMQLITEKDLLLKKSERQHLISSIVETLSGEHSSNITSSLHSIILQLEKENNTVSNENLEKLHNSFQLLEEVSYNLSKEADTEESNSRIEAIVDRLDLYQKLKRRFQGTTESILEAKEEFQKEHNQLKELDQQIESLKKQLHELEIQLLQQAENLHYKRVKGATQLSTLISKGVQSLMMTGATVKFDITRKKVFSSSGFSSIQFIAETNPGEGFHLVKKSASGGELSRILLTLRQVVASNESISVFLFDEIDAGIGGETAICTGKALKKVSSHSQVIAITHLPQIAFQADKLINVIKVVDDSSTRTFSSITEYIGIEKDKYITKMSQLN